MAKKIKTEDELVKTHLKENVQEDDLLKKIADEVVFRHILISKLVFECLQANNKQHDDLLALKLYNAFEKELIK